ncbi:hypothetical protein GLAREA_04341 [Glarea lozoyensis ATCC 20868]|uniref:Uncharacterized protein n=1 Tax=Glarea lozoyensis (strain ATCC 20868 / MF5171) TaxID=1116229 RepID=S3CPB2_GLAL2|nr:uncharacterized protein GLAREA_04341 [Glarea lozoyensis ATCC 20868]EPE27550.1 hypothetical protein GLAREA_04341 [Glarea lozoyensis ATCC 20868]
MANNQAVAEMAIRDVSQSTNTTFPSTPLNLTQTPEDLRLKWVSAITSDLRRKEDQTYPNTTRDFQIALNHDGSIENLAKDPYLLIEIHSEDPSIRDYTPRFNLPKQIEDHLPSREDKIERKELFALGGLVYQLISGKGMFDDFANNVASISVIEQKFIAGEFPDDVWGLKAAVRVLGCWCPPFAKEFVDAEKERERKEKAAAKKKNLLLGAKILGGGLATTLAAPVVLPLVGFGGGGVVAGSLAAAWQSSIGIVQGGSVFAFLTSAGAGGAATAAFMATGVAGASLLVAATGAGFFDKLRNETEVVELREHFLEVWRRDLK